MLIYIDRLEEELKSILHFWDKYAFYDTHKKVYPEVSIDRTGNLNTDTGTIYLSRILYGTSASCNYFKTREYSPMAESAYNLLIKNHKNPDGGYFWGINPENKPIHDNRAVSFAQAFIIYGLCEYYQLTRSNEVLNALKEQIDFIETTLYDHDHGGYLDGFDIQWESSGAPSKSLGTHLHLMEAYVKFLQIEQQASIKIRLKELLEIILNRIIDLNTGEAIHIFDTTWKPEPNENWVGHNMEISWLICQAADVLNDDELAGRCKKTAIRLVEENMKTGQDHHFGGIFNIFRNNKPVTHNKESWPQAETVIALINVFQLNGDKRMLNDALRLFEFIDSTISDGQRGEWYDSVTKEGKPTDTPKLHFWKSMYHNVRYCIEVASRFNDLINQNA
jgi:cellobiose epimerase